MSFRRTHNMLTAKIFLLCLFGSLVFPLYIQAATYPIVWNPASIEQTIGLGGTKDVTVTFTSRTKLKNVDLWIVPELQPFVRAEPNHFDVIERNVVYQVRVHIAIPSGTQSGLHDGTIHLRIGSVTYSQTLKTKLTVLYENPAQVMTAFKQTVQVGDINRMIMHFEEKYQDIYRALFDTNKDKLSELSECLNSLAEEKTGETISVYKFKFIDDEGDLITNQIFLKKDEVGNWKIIAF